MFHAEIEATNHCNTRCLQCPHEVMSRPRGRMEWETYETIVRKIRAHVNGEKFSLSFSGMGEPLLHPSIFRFIRHVSDDAFTGFATNGAALTEENVGKLIEAGLDVVYVSFNGDEPELYAKMMGGLRFERVLGHVRKTVQLAQGSRLRVNANVSVTKANRDRLTQIRSLLESEGVGAITFSMCHSRGGNLRDASVYDTPAMPEDDGHCEVLKNTLFIDWRGKVFICDHDIHGEHGLGDLMTEPLEVILARRQKLVHDGLPFQICRECNDLLKVGFRPLASGAGGQLPEWIYSLYQEAAEPLSEATTGLKWIYKIYEKENRVDRLVNRLLKIEKTLQEELAGERSANVSLGVEVETLRWEMEREMAKKDRHGANLAHQIKLTRDHVENLEKLGGVHQQRIGELDRQCFELDRAIADRDAEIDRLRRTEEKLRRVQASVSWRMTAPLRYLRRKCLDGRIKPATGPTAAVVASNQA